MTTRSWKGLQRRLLHAIMTQDSFVLSMGGHSAAARHGNRFLPSYTLQVQERILQQRRFFLSYLSVEDELSVASSVSVAGSVLIDDDESLLPPSKFWLEKVRRRSSVTPL